MKSTIVILLIPLALFGCYEDDEDDPQIMLIHGTDYMFYQGGHPLATSTTDTYVLGNEAELVRLTNDHRVAIGLNALISDVPLSDVARAHSRHMIVHDFFGHTNPEGDYITERMVKYGMHGTLWGENICVGAYTPLHAFNTLLASPGHKYVMELPDWRYIGVGYWEDTYDSGTYIYRQYWTQNFSNY